MWHASFLWHKRVCHSTGLKSHPPVECIPGYIVKTEPRQKKLIKEVEEEGKQPLPTVEHDLMYLVGKSFKNSDLLSLLEWEDTRRTHKESLGLLWFTHNILLTKDPGNNILLKYVNFCQDIEAFMNYHGFMRAFI